MRVLVLGGGGREHALIWAFSQNPKCDHLYCAPGNAGIAEQATCVDLDIMDADAVLAFCRDKTIGFVMIGPEAPLAIGVADKLRTGGLLTFGPSEAAAQLEASKAFTKEICAACNAPTAASATFEDVTTAKAYVDTAGLPIVIKDDGLAAGKGVTIAETGEAAHAALDAIFTQAAPRVVIEEFMDGEEASLFVLADGTNACVIGTAQDHKRAFDGDQGPNTGGMGAYSPAPVLTPDITERAMAQIVNPTLQEMARRGTPFQGVLYVGLMIANGQPRLVEYNVRFGDPEAQVLAMRLGAQLFDLCLACAKGELAGLSPNWAEDHSLTIVMAARGYPGRYEKGEALGLPGLQDPTTMIFHAGTRENEGRITSNGGRVLNITARAGSLQAAHDRAYDLITQIDWPGGVYRRDIGWRALSRTDAETVPG